MLCEICKKRQATVHLTEIINDKKTKLHICEVCAREKGEEMQTHFGLTDLIGSLMDFSPAIAEEKMQSDISAKCGVCGMTYYDFQKTGKLGCGGCYDAFKDELSVLLKKIHGSDRHIGKMPFNGEKAMKHQETLAELKNRLNQYIRDEQFEKAASVRDSIKEIEKQINKEA
ncbi:MAG: UvrB/UvrC motif-containing protein [Candidatus Omnitrophica bacterium]|nr:UvrB/UvrC motif-containing protein [Candidatus Omnitrophota bacterium]